MLRNYLTIALRNLLRYKIYSAINIVGLAIGMAACLLIMLFVGYEWSFDRMHRKNMFRLGEVQQFEGMVAPQKVPLTPFAVSDALRRDFPEVRNATHFMANGNIFLHHGEKHIPVPASIWADPAFLRVFDFRLLSGDRRTALGRPGSVVLTRETARKFFGETNPLGKTISYYGMDTLTFQVTGVLENVPANSHLQFDALLSMGTIEQPAMRKDWDNHYVKTYLELAPGTDVAALERKFPAFLQKYMGQDAPKSFTLFLQPLGEVHGGSADITHDYNNYQKFDRRHTWLFAALALAVLTIAALNFMNLSTARAAGRAREVGVRKAIGAFRSQLAAQFVGESVLLSLLALGLALVLVYLALPLARTISERDLPFPLFASPWLLPVILAATVAVGVLSGLYPAAVLSAFEPVKVLKGAMHGVGRKATLRNLLVMGQFAAGIFLVIGMIISTRQLRYMLHRDPGFDREQVVVLTMDATTSKKYQAIRQELLRQPGVVAVTAAQQRLGNNLFQTPVKYRGNGPTRELNVSQVVVDLNYLSFYRIALVAGRDFSPAYASDDGRAFIVNETLARELLSNTPGRPVHSLLGQPFGFGDADTLGTIVGVARDFHFNSLHHKIESLVIAAAADVAYGEVSVRVEAGQAQAVIGRAEAIWKRLAPGQPFEYAFLDQYFGQLYRTDEQVSQVVSVLAGLAVLIACLGLFGLALYTTQLRTKEIGIRKVLGASVGSLVALLSGDFLKLVGGAFLLAAPLAWLAFGVWLELFAYRIGIEWWVFALAGLLAVGVAWLTVSVQSIRTARANPVKSLRSE